MFAAGILLMAVLTFIVYNRMNGAEGAVVRVMTDGGLYGVYSLSEEQVIKIASADGDWSNELVIRDRKAKMTEADCPDRLCVKQRAVSRTGESIVCLPHKIIITVEKAKEAEYDSISR